MTIEPQQHPMITIRKARQSDSVPVFAWRNDALTRQMSRSSEEVEWTAHQLWFAATLRDPDRLLLLCEQEPSGQRVAMVRFDLTADRTKALISINLAPASRGQKLSVPCIKAALDHLRINFPSVSEVIAEIKTANVASQKAFEALGFTLQSRPSDLEIYSRVMVAP
jgi:UDP-2,4-diacetamido-2,4,6-trideoxy-beta-L-altropyranose hydrolase